MQDPVVLTVNSGSSSLKLAWFRLGDAAPVPVCKVDMKGIGSSKGTLQLTHCASVHGANDGDRDGADAPARRDADPIQGHWADQASALDAAMHRVAETAPDAPWATAPDAVAHRIVHGGPHLLAHGPIDDRTRALLQDAMPFAPLHLPVELALIDATRKRLVGTPQYACLDTVFHARLPEVAKRLPVPETLRNEGIHRYGFHGLSYEHAVATLGDTIPERTVIAHLGSGASLAAVHKGAPMDTTMGLGPTGGIPMSSRSGDLDPTVLLYLMREHDYDADKLEMLLDHQSGLKALSGSSGDVQALEGAAEKGDADAALALDAFATAVAKTVGAYAAVLGGLDLLVFTGGIGEHGDTMRRRIARKLAFLAVETRVLAADENLQMARHVRQLMR